MPDTSFHCDACGEHHDGSHGGGDDWPALSFHRPDPYLELTPEEQERAHADDDLVVIDWGDQVDRFIRVTLSLPVIGHQRTLEYGPWVSLSEQSFTDYVDHWDDPDHHAHYFGWLSTAIPGYEFPQPLAMRVTTRGDLRPFLEPDPEVDHPLVRDFYDGISYEEAELRIRSLLLED